MNVMMKMLAFQINARAKMFFFDMITNIHNPLSQRLTNTHNSIENEVLMFKLNNLQIKFFYEFIIDPLFFIFPKTNSIIYSVVGTRLYQSYK
jgi:hypothetical protein